MSGFTMKGGLLYCDSKDDRQPFALPNFSLDQLMRASFSLKAHFTVWN